MADIHEYALLVGGRSREQFSVEHPHAFLLVKKPPSKEMLGWSFNTHSDSSWGRFEAQLAKQGLSVSDELHECELYPLKKSAENPLIERVTVGRARNNDIVLADHSVSKVHVYFQGTSSTSYRVSDAGSHNGTLLNGKKLLEGEQAPVRSKDMLRLGRINLIFMNATDLYELLVASLKAVRTPRR
jgi:hypothetical protein